MINGSQNPMGANPFVVGGSSNDYNHGPGSFSSAGYQNRSDTNSIGGLSTSKNRVNMQLHDESSPNIPVKYRIAFNQSSNAFTITLLVPKNHNQTVDQASPFRKIIESSSSNPDKETHIFRITLGQLISQSQSTSVPKNTSWLDSPTLRKRLGDGGNAVGLDSNQIYQSIAAVEESASRISDWIPYGTESVNVDVFLADGLISLMAVVNPVTPSSHGGLDFSFMSFQEKSEHIATHQASLDQRVSIFNHGQADGYGRPDSVNGLFGQNSASLDSWISNTGDSRMNFAKDSNFSSFFQSASPYQTSDSDRPILGEKLFSGTGMNNFQNTFQSSTIERPAPSSIIEPLLAMGFTRVECDAAVNAIENISKKNYSDSPPGYDDNSRNFDSTIGTIGNELNAKFFPTNADISSNEPESTQDFSKMGETNDEVTGPVWGNVGKLKVVKSYANEEDVSNKSSEVGSSQILDGQQPQKIVKVLDIPPEMNAFVFHCNAQTREESLERCLFGCPSGGQYGPHSKAKKGDLLFLADFSSWTVSGIFVAKTDAQLNIDKTAWNGRFPWQIRVEPWSELKTIHIDKVNEIIGLASGSKLNMLTKDQLVHLVESKEFGASVPPSLYKTKSVPQTQKLSQVKDSPVIPTTSESVGVAGGQMKTNIQGIKYSKVVASSTFPEEHPATAMRRLRLVTSWFDSFAGELLYMNEILNGKKPSTKKESTKEKVEADGGDAFRILKKRTDLVWESLSYSYIRRAIADVFDQWLLFIQCVNEDVNESSDQTESSDWTQQRKSVVVTSKSDILLLSRIPGSKECIKDLLRSTVGTSALSVPEELADLLASTFLREIENISQEVRKTQISLLKIGGDDYMKSITAKALGMKVVESEKQTDDLDKPIVRIEWHTKSSIAQGRPPQIQKIYKDQFNILAKTYKAIAAVDDPTMDHFLPRLFVLLCRYDLIGDIKNRCQALVPSSAWKCMVNSFGVGHECFASPFNHECSSFTSTFFSDSDKYFGSIGSFFDLIPLEGSYQVNPPFIGENMKPLFDRIIALLQDANRDRRPLSFIVSMREDAILNQVQRSIFCRRIASFENDSKYTINTQHKDTVPASRKQMKSDNINTVECSGAWSNSKSTSIVWLQSDIAYNIWSPSDDKVEQLIECFQMDY